MNSHRNIGKKSDREILDELEKRPDARTRDRIHCDKCGSKDHVKKVKDLYLCPQCRGTSSKRKGKKRR